MRNSIFTRLGIFVALLVYVATLTTMLFAVPSTHVKASSPLDNARLFIKLSPNLAAQDVNVKLDRITALTRDNASDMGTGIDYGKLNSYSLQFDQNKKQYSTTFYVYGLSTNNACSPSLPLNNFKVTISGKASGKIDKWDGGCVEKHNWADVGLGIGDREFTKTVNVQSPADASRKGKVKGKLVKPDSSPVEAGYKISIVQAGSHIGDIEVGSDGQFEFTNITPGTYKIYSFEDKDYCTPSGCFHFTKDNVKIEAGKTIDLGTITLIAKVEPTGGGTSDTDTCENGDGALRWIMCPLVIAIDGSLNWVDSRINEILKIDQGYYNNHGIKVSSARIRNIAFIILVPIMLVMVISTALGFEFISAYTVKRALPRLIIAAIFISLSYNICVFLIEFSNVVGSGVLGLLTSPFGSGANGASALTLSSLFGGSIFTSIPAAALALIGALVALMFFGGTLLLFASIAFLTLMLRQMFIVALLLMAPLAILAWIFPGNDKMWKLWWGSFSKLLMMYPLILGLIAVGRIFAFIIHSSNPAGLEGTIMTPLMIMIAYMIPYAFIPFTFKFAGGIFATVTGSMNDKSKGLFDRLSKGRARKLEKTLNERAFRPNTRLGKALNRPMQTTAMALMGRGGINPFRMRGRINSERGILAGTEMGKLLEENDDIKAAAVDDHMAEAVQVAQGRAEIETMLRRSARYADANPAEMAEAVALVERAQRAGSTTAVRSAMSVARANSGTGYATSSDMYESIIQAAGGDRRLEGSLLAACRAGSERARRPDLAAAGHVEQAVAMNQLRATIGGDEAAHQATRATVNAEIRRASFEAAGAHAMVSGRPQAVTELVEGLQADWETATATGDVDAAGEIAAQITSLRSAMGSAPAANRQQIINLLEQTGVDQGAINTVTGQAVSVDEQYGTILEQLYNTQRQAATGQQPTETERRDVQQRAAQTVRTRAGLYDVGGGNLTPAQMEARRATMPPEQQ